MKRMTFTINEVTYEVDFNKGSRKALDDYGITHYTIAGTIMGLGEKLNKMEDGEKFIIIDKSFRLAIVSYMDKVTNCIEVVAVVSENNIFVKDGVKLFEYDWTK